MKSEKLIVNSYFLGAIHSSLYTLHSLLGHFFFLYSPSAMALASSTPSPLRSDIVPVFPSTFQVKLNSSPFLGFWGKFPFSSTSVTVALTVPSLSIFALQVTIAPFSP